MPQVVQGRESCRAHSGTGVDVVGDDLFEGAAGHRFDEQAEQDVAGAVVEMTLPGREVGLLVGEQGQVVLVAPQQVERVGGGQDSPFGLPVVAALFEPVADARCHCQGVADRDTRIELGHVVSHEVHQRFVQADLFSLDELQDGHRCEHRGHRRHAEARVARVRYGSSP
nr:hypothetical protein [Streptomyces violaceusniger]